MKKGVLYSSIFGLTLILASIAVFSPQDNKEYYQPREQKTEGAAEGYKGAAEWLYSRRANQITGEIDPQDVLNARAQSRAMAIEAKSKKSTIGLQWEEVGPDNIGGRTRAFLISNQDANTFFAGSVSGGLFRSTNAGASWYAVNDMEENLAVTSLAQAPNGDIYYGTGEGLYYDASGGKSMGILGQGIYKSTDGGQTFTQLQNTVPQNFASSEWASVGKIEVDPNNSQRVYAATNRGLRISEDGGNTWSNGNPNGNFVECTDMIVTPSGTLWAKIGNRMYKSQNTDGTNLQEVTSMNAGTNDLPQNGGRMRMAVSPQDENYVYVVSITAGSFIRQGGEFNKAYRSTDGGDTWTVIGEKNVFLDPHRNQGNYNNAVTVDPKDKDRVLIGGVTLWEWSATGGWQQLASNIRFAAVSSLYIHSDIHNIIFRPNAPNTIYVCSDGGIGRSTDNGLTWVEMVKNYGTIQFYNIGLGGDGAVIGGTQDNSNILINPNAQILARTGTILNSGDGGYAEISELNPNVLFLESQYGNALRSTDYGQSLSQFLDLDRMAPNPNIQPGSGDAFADFVAPFEIYENVFDFNSEDSIIFRADSVSYSLGIGGGKTRFNGTFVRPQKTTDFLIDGVRVKAGDQVATTDINGNFVGDVDTGSFNPATGEFTLTFSKPVPGFEVIAKVAVKYDGGDTIVLKSKTNSISLTRVVPAGGLGPNQSEAYQDPVQSAFFMGLTGRSVNNDNQQGGIWMSRDAISNVVSMPTWYHIGNIANGEKPQCMAVSHDGDVLYVGCNTGRVYRFSNISSAWDSASTDIDNVYKADTLFRANTSVIQRTIVSSGLPNGQIVVGMGFHPRDKNKLLITYGAYGNNNYVYYSSNASAAIPTFASKHGNLPQFPVYDAIFNATGPEGQVVVGAEDGIFTTDDINAANVQWTKEINGFANVPVFDLEQQLTVRKDLQLFGNLEGTIYAGTHGRGVFRTTTTQKIDLDENKLDEDVTDRKFLKLYPNPATDRVFIPLNLTNRSDVVITVRDINGKLVRNVKYDKLSKDVENVELNVSSLPSGAYVVTLIKGSEVISGKLVKQ